MRAETRRQLILTNLNPSVYAKKYVSSFLPELLIYSLLYEEVLIREDDLIVNKVLTNHLAEPENLRVFEELLSTGVVRLLCLAKKEYGPGLRRDPLRQPISARAEEHERRRSYKGRPWRASARQWQLYSRLDTLVCAHPKESVRVQKPFPAGNQFASELAEILEDRESYRLRHRRAFNDIDDEMADAFLSFCWIPDAWTQFLAGRGVRNPLQGTGGDFYRTAAYQCLEMFPRRNGMRRLIESIYAACDCAREDADGRYGRSALAELPYRLDPSEDPDTATLDITKIEMVPTEAAVKVGVGPGIGDVLTGTRNSPAFQHLQAVLASMGSAEIQEAMVIEAWRSVSAVFAEQWAKAMVPRQHLDKQVAEWTAHAYVAARVLGFMLAPTESSIDPVRLLIEHHALNMAIEHCAPILSQKLRALLAVPKLFKRTQQAAAIRCTRVQF